MDAFTTTSDVATAVLAMRRATGCTTLQALDALRILVEERSAPERRDARLAALDYLTSANREARS